MAPWEQLAGLMDGIVDTIGDDLSYARGSGEFLPVKGFVVTSAEPQQGDSDYLDTILGVRKRVKINKALFLMATGDRVRHPKLGAGTWKILGPEDDEQTQGRYQISDVQKAGL